MKKTNVKKKEKNLSPQVAARFTTGWRPWEVAMSYICALSFFFLLRIKSLFVTHPPNAFLFAEWCTKNGAHRVPVINLSSQYTTMKGTHTRLLAMRWKRFGYHEWRKASSLYLTISPRTDVVKNACACLSHPASATQEAPILMASCCSRQLRAGCCNKTIKACLLGAGSSWKGLF